MNTVLIVDDSSFMRLLIRKMLEKRGFLVVGEAENGAVGIEKFKEFRPEIVTLDVTMSQMDGLATLTALMAISPDVKVVMISALGQESVIRKAIKIGAKTFIVKPFKEGHVITALNKILMQK